MINESNQKGFEWQVGVWDTISDIYLQEVDKRFVPVVNSLITRADLRAGEKVLDLGSGTGAVAEQAAKMVSSKGQILGVDISPDMIAISQRIMNERGLTNVTMLEGRAEALPIEDGSVDVVLASLSLMYVIDRAAAAREIARVLKPHGRFVAAVWSDAEQCDIVLFQQTAGRFADTPPVPNVGPSSLADPSLFLKELADAGIEAHVETETLGFDFDDFQLAWDVLAGVTTAMPVPTRGPANTLVYDQISLAGQLEQPLESGCLVCHKGQSNVFGCL